MAPIKAGGAIPSVDLFEGNPDTKVNLAEVCKEGKYVIFGVPGQTIATRPGVATLCSDTITRFSEIFTKVAKFP